MTMWLPSAKFLLASNACEQSIFLAQLWHELLSNNSSDSFRAKALDLPLLMEELLKVCSYAQQEPKWISHVHLICEEIKSYLPVARTKQIPVVSDSILASIANYHLGAQEIPRLVEQINIFLELHKNYLGCLVESVRVLSVDSGKKKQITIEMGSLATHVQARGASEESILKVNDDICSLKPEEIIERLCGDIDRGARNYSCYIAIAAPRALASRLFAARTFREVGKASFSNDLCAAAWYEQRKEGIVVEWNVAAGSRQKAADLALAEVFSLIHLHALYANNVRVTASPKVLIEEDGKFCVVEVTPSRHFGLEPRRDAEKLSRDRYTDLQGRLNGRLTNLLESHALAVSASDARSAVFHLWTALETLAGGLGSGSIGERVADVVAPIVTWRRIDKIVTYLAINGHQLREHVATSYDLTNLPYSSKRHVDRVDMLKGITGPNGNPAIMAAFAAFTHSPLLIHRLYRAWEECNDPVELRKTLTLSRNRVKWQVMRFYRARNLLVHYGEVDNLAMRLLENAQYYLSICVGRVLHDLSSHKTWDVTTSLEFQKHKFDSLIGRLQSKPHDIRIDEVLVHANSSYASDLIWPKAEKGKGDSGKGEQ